MLSRIVLGPEDGQEVAERRRHYAEIQSVSHPDGVFSQLDEPNPSRAGLGGGRKGRTELAGLPVPESVAVEVGRCLGRVVGEDGHVAAERDGVLRSRG